MKTLKILSSNPYKISTSNVGPREFFFTSSSLNFKNSVN